MYSFMQTPVPVIAAMGVGAAGLLAGIAFTAAATRHKLRVARQLVNAALRCEIEARRTYTNVRALTEPTQSVPVIELFPPSRVRQLRDAVADAVERYTTRDEKLPDWADGELTATFARIAQEEAEQATPYGNPGQPGPTYRNRQHDRHTLPARQRLWGTRPATHLGGRATPPELFASVAVPVQRKPTPLAVARRLEMLPDDTRQWRVRVAA